jgi:starch phosphorylase
MNHNDPLPELPSRIDELQSFVYNLWWSWHEKGLELFQMIDAQAWRDSDHNPIEMLAMLPEGRLQALAEDETFLAHYDAVMEQFNVEIGADDHWFSNQYGKAHAPVAYFSTEYGLHASLPVYAGGLGVLAGDHLKACSDLGVPLIAVGMFYSEGYVRQRIREDGWQAEVKESLDRTYNPIKQVMNEDGEPLKVQVPALEPPVHVYVWQVNVGRVTLYLLDPALDINRAWDQGIGRRLYASNTENRLRQEILLGMGGMRALEAMDIQPGATHLNEGHATLANLERIRILEEREGLDFDAALEQVRSHSIFTTHTPVPAGTDVFSFELMEEDLGEYVRELGIDRNRFFELGKNPDDPQAGFNMTVFALRVAQFRNAVSRRHGEVSRDMWSSLWPDAEPDAIPIASITNGVHLPSWIEPNRLQPVLDDHLGPSWTDDRDNPDVWDDVDTIPGEVIWEVHQRLKEDLLTEIDSRARDRWFEEHAAPSNVIAYGPLLDPEALTVGFARRFTGYKRPDLILHDLDRIKALLTDPFQPIQIIFAGEAHPADNEGKRLIQKIFRYAQSSDFMGRIAFVEDYDEVLAGYMVRGVDVWLNNPIPPQEASGTSGMKASVNGVPHLSIPDGWWIEGYEGDNGWTFGDEAITEDRREADANALYQVLEDEIIPLYYDRDNQGIPQRFVDVMKQAIKRAAPTFSAQRMVKDYVRKFYVEVLNGNSDKAS